MFPKSNMTTTHWYTFTRGAEDLKPVNRKQYLPAKRSWDVEISVEEYTATWQAAADTDEEMVIALEYAQNAWMPGLY